MTASETFHIPRKVMDSVGKLEAGKAWLDALPQSIDELERRWKLQLGRPFDGESGGSWVAPCKRQDGQDAVLKVGFPHMEAEDELLGLQFWSGDPGVFVFDADPSRNAILMERCDPGTMLRELPEEDQDPIIVEMLQKLWRDPGEDHGFRTLVQMIDYWIDEAQSASGGDVATTKRGIAVYNELCSERTESKVLATDLHAGNVLRATRKPWLVIDPKPFVGDPTYDVTQHILNCKSRLSTAPEELVGSLSGQLDVDAKRVMAWTYARLATQSGSDRRGDQRLAQRLEGLF